MSDTSTHAQSLQPAQPLQLYTSPEWGIQINAHVQDESMWLSLKQISALFGRDKSGISRHIKKIYESGELDQASVVAKIATTAADGKTYEVDYYNLDMIISVGYRVDSKQATHFRKWATSTLSDHVMKGYTVNPARLEQTGTEALAQSLALVRRALESKELSTDETAWLLDLLVTYLPGITTLNKFDSSTLPEYGQTNEEQYKIQRLEAIVALANLKAKLIAKGEATDLFAHPKDDNGLDSIFWAIYQTYDGVDVYQSVEEKAAMVLYLVIKNHPFADGNKRSGAFLFVWYLSKNGILLDETGKEKISHQTMVALALLIATSDPSEKEMMVKLVVALLR